MKPYYEDPSGIVIYHGDCREILPSLPKVDLVLTDPPYGMAFQSNHRAVRHAPIVGDGALDVELIKACIEKATAAAYIFCRWDNLQDMPKPRSVLAWVKNNWSMGDLMHEHGRQWEAICFYPGMAHQFVTRIPDVIHADRTGNDLHPTQKPIALMQRLMAANVGDTIMDPYSGSGTTLVAAKRLGRKAIGIEIEENYCEIAARRIQEASMPLLEALEPKQEMLLEWNAEIDRCDQEIAALDALPEDIPAKAVDLAMARNDWEHEKRLIRGER